MKLNMGVLLLSVLALVASGCTKNSNELNPHLRLSKNIISTRATNSTHFVAIVKLKNSALLESAKFSDGKTELDNDLLKQINDEQEAAIAALKALSPEVQIIYRYKMVLNAVAVLAPIELADKIKGLGLVAYSESSGSFERPKTLELSNSIAAPAFLERNSSKFIGAEKLNQFGITGKGVKVGIIDTGIDYTHAMFFGEGTEEAYKAIDPSTANSAFPNKKVVGGVDLVGTTYDAASLDFANHIPKPDMNPLDEAGHGSHVAGTVAGHGDGINTYNGMAPDADLHAIKVFGAEGSTSDFVVIAALEYAADPNGDGNNEDVLDVVNLSLGSGYGNPHILYTEAIKNLVKGGTVVVASAGNSGHEDYIVGAPSTADAALSVAASIDNGDQLWKFNASRINLGTESIMVEAVEAATTKGISEGNVSGKLVYVGLAIEDLSAEQAAAVKGNIALIDRGVVPFNDKVKRAAAAGASGVVVANNRDGSALAMGTTDKFEIPAIMITLADAKKTKAAMAAGDVTLDFKTDFKIEKPELIDTLTDFTSKGPRSIDGMIKPEISAPGENVISAAMGQGAKAVQMSGTSMAAPHMTGVIALLRQAKPKLSAEELKSLAMGRSKTMSASGKVYSVSLQGAGRVQADVAAASPVVAAESSISLGEINVESKKSVRREISLKNLTAEPISLTYRFEGNGFISMAGVEKFVIDGGGTAIVPAVLTLDATAMREESIREMDGWVLFEKDGQEVYRLPVLAVAHRLSQVEAGGLRVSSNSEADAGGASATLLLKNPGLNSGEAMLFNLIGKDERKPFAESFMNSDCDLQAAGYRLKGDVLQVAIKLWKPMTTWHSCDVSVMIDTNGDGVAEQELLGSNLKSIPGQTAEEFATTLLDAAKVRSTRLAFEKLVADAKNDPEKLAKLKQAEDYSDAIIDQRGLVVFNNSSVMVLEISAAKLALTREGNLNFKVIVTHNEQGSVESDDLLKENAEADSQISLRKEDQSFLGLADFKVTGGGEQQVFLTKGEGKEKLMVLFPENKFSLSNLHEDSQSQFLNAVYLAP